jgi:uncharacterized membrane protein
MTKKRQLKKEKEVRGLEPDKLFLINKKLDLILENQKKLIAEEERVEEEELGEEAEERKVEGLEKEEISKLEKLENLEEELKKQTAHHPLIKITYHDIAKGGIGAFIGIILHYTIMKGVEIAASITITRAAMLYPLSFFVGMVFLYATGFKKIKQRRVLAFLPLRITVLYLVSIILSIGMLYILYPAFGQTYSDAFKQVATVSLPAVVGACTADIIGKND